MTPALVRSTTKGVRSFDSGRDAEGMFTETVFKTCPLCAQIWPTRDEFLADPQIVVNGYTADFDDIESSLFLFTHRKNHCGSSMGLEASHFLDLYAGERSFERKTGTGECPLYCLDKEKLNRCKSLCEYAFVREILQIVKNWEKR